MHGRILHMDAIKDPILGSKGRIEGFRLESLGPELTPPRGMHAFSATSLRKPSEYTQLTGRIPNSAP